jgi:type II secretory pathway pseudopilin PulG
VTGCYRKNTRFLTGCEDGFTLLEAVVASMITAATIVLILMFSIRTFEISNNMSVLNDINHSLRRSQESFIRDVKMAQYFFFGATEDNEGNQVAKDVIDRRVLTLGYENVGGEMIWTMYDVKVGTDTGIYYLLRTSNELDGGTAFETTILATDVEDLYFTYFDENDFETTVADKISRIEMTLILADEEITQKVLIASTLRGANLGVGIPDKNLGEYQRTNFIK